MRALVADAGLGDEVEIESCGTGSWHLGQAPDGRAVEAAAQRGITLTGTAQRVEPADLERFDYVLAMDRDNLAELRAMASDSAQRARIGLLREYDADALAADELEVPDPYYGEHGFEHVFDQLEAACRGLLARITSI